MKELVRFLLIWVGCPAFITMCLWPFCVWLAPEEVRRPKLLCWVLGFLWFYGAVIFLKVVMWAFSP